MGQPVVHFEIIGADGEALKAYYAEMFGWEIDSGNPMNYGTVAREDNLSADGVGIGGGVAGYEGVSHVTFYVAVPDVEAALQKAVALGGQRLMGPEKVTEGVEIGSFTDPEGHMIGLIKGGA